MSLQMEAVTTQAPQSQPISSVDAQTNQPTAVASSEAQLYPQQALVQKAAKEARNVVRDIAINIVAAFVLAGLGWLAWSWTSHFGIRYSDAKRPWAREISSEYILSNDLGFNSHVDITEHFSSDTPEDVITQYDKTKRDIISYENSNKQLAETKAFTKGALAKDFKSYQQKRKQFMVFAQNRNESYKTVMTAIYTCKAYDYKDSADTTKSNFKECIQLLESAAQKSIPEKEYKVFLDKLTALVSQRNDAYSTWKSAVPRSTEAETAYNKFAAAGKDLFTLSSTTNKTLDKSYAEYSLRETLKSIDEKFVTLVDKEGK